MPDLPVTLSRPDLDARLFAAFDADMKLPRALDDLGRLRDRDVVLVDGDAGRRAEQLGRLGARVRQAPLADLAALPEDSADAVVAPWIGFAAGDPAFDDELAAARRVGRAEGRLLVVQDYGRDDVRDLVGLPPGMAERPRDRDDWFLRRGFKVRVVHCWWTFDSLDDARGFLADAFGAPGEAVAESLRRPRLAHKVAIYHLDV